MSGNSMFRLIRVAGAFAAFTIGYLVRRPFVRRHRAALFGRLLVSCLESCGPTFVKIGQILSSRYDLFERDTLAELQKLQDRVAPLPAAQLLDQVRCDLGVNFALFASIDNTPLASGSVAQVHRASTRDGLELVLKIRRPNIEAIMMKDFAAMMSVARILERSGLAGTIPIVAIVTELSTAVTMQLDFMAEAEHYRRFHENLGGFGALIMPTVIPGLSTSRLLVMEYVDDLTRVERLELDPRERRAAAVAGLRLLYHMIFIDGFVHADMHPGNIFFGPGRRVVLLDMGLVADMDPRLRRAFVDFFLGLATGNGHDCARVVWETAIWRKVGCDRAAFEDHMRMVVTRHASLSASDFEVSRFVIDIFDAQRRAGICGTTSFMMVILSLLTYEGVVKTLWPQLDFQAEARDFVLRATFAF